MELLRGKSIYSFKRLEDVLKKLPSTTDGTIQILAIAHTEISILQQHFPIHPSMLYGASPETTPRTRQFFIPEAIRNTCKLCLVP